MPHDIKYTIEYSILGDVALIFLPPNSAGGVQYLFAAEYFGNKTVNYYTINYKLKNAVGDPAYDEILGRSEIPMKIIGPVHNNEILFDISKDDPNFYCDTCSELCITSIDLEYDDKTTQTIDVNMSWTMAAPTPGYEWIQAINTLEAYHSSIYEKLS